MNATATPASSHVPFTNRELPDTPAGILRPRILTAIAADAAACAAALLRGRGAELHDDVVDLVRLVQETECDAGAAGAAADRAGLSSAAFSRLRVAYTFAGLEGVHTAHRAHDPETGVMNAAVDAIHQRHTVSEDALIVERNHITAQTLGVQVRLSVKARWFPYTSSGQGWAPVRGESPNPADAYGAAVQARRSRQR